MTPEGVVSMEWVIRAACVIAGACIGMVLTALMSAGK